MLQRARERIIGVTRSLRSLAEVPVGPGGTDPGSGGKEASDGRWVVENHLTSGGSQFLVVAVPPGDTHREQSVLDSGTHVITTVPHQRN